MTPVTHRIAWGCNSICESSTDSLRPGRRAVQKRALVGSDGKQPGRRRPATPPLTSQVNPGRTADNSERHTDERLKSPTCGGGSRRQTTSVYFKASKRVRWLPGERALWLPNTWCTRRRSGRNWSQVRQESRHDVFARPRGHASRQDHYTGRLRRGQESRWAVGKKQGNEGGIWHLDVVDGRIPHGQW